MTDALLLSCISASIMVIWFETNAFCEWVSLLGVGKKFFKIDKFEEYSESELDPNAYPHFLVQSNPTFFNKILSCPYCINFYICVIMFIALKDFISPWFYSFVYLTSLAALLVIKKLGK